MLRQIVKAVSRYVPLPLMAVLECTKVCNLKCTYCRRWSVDSCAKKGSVGVHMDPGEFMYILNSIPTLRQVDWMGEGEPLCNPYFNRMIELSHRRLITTGLTTNAMLVDKDIARFWKKNGVNKVGVSLDSPIKSMYEEMRKGAHFETVVDNCRVIRNEGLFLQLNLVLFQENVEHLAEYIRLAKDVGAKRIDLIRPHYYEWGPTHYSDLVISKENDEAIKEGLKDAKGLEFFQPIYSGPYFRKCTWPFIAPYISIGGNIYSCCFMADTPEKRVEYLLGKPFYIPCRNYLMGNILKENFWRIWYGDSYKQLRSLLKESEKPSSSTVTLEELKQMEVEDTGAFDHCKRCGWRWSLVC